MNYTDHDSDAASAAVNAAKAAVSTNSTNDVDRPGTGAPGHLFKFTQVAT
jgi:hypothetical protein